MVRNFHLGGIVVIHNISRGAVKLFAPAFVCYFASIVFLRKLLAAVQHRLGLSREIVRRGARLERLNRRFRRCRVRLVT